MALMHGAIADGAQFVVATHSPILLAYPDARIYSFDETPVAAVEYAELEHVALTKAFLEDPVRYLRRVLE
jgi:predicted ATPase